MREDRDMDKEKLNEAAEDIANRYGFDDFDKVSVDFGFKAGADWLMKQPLADRLTDEEKEKVREIMNAKGIEPKTLHMFDENDEEQMARMRTILRLDPSKAPMVVFENSELKFVHTNIDEKEFEEFKERQRNNPLNNLWLELAIAEEKAQAERRRLWIRGIIKSALNKLGKNPTDELLDVATDFYIGNLMLSTLNPTRNHWFFDMLCCFCDGKPYEYDGGKVELKYKQ